MLIARRLFYILFLFPLFQIYAQTHPGIEILRNDSIFILNSKSDGQLDFIFKFKAGYLDSIGAIAYNNSDGSYYGIRYNDAHLIRFRPDRFVEDLGTSIDSSGKLLPNEDLTSAVIHDNYMFVLSYSTNSIYKIDLNSGDLSYSILTSNIGFNIPNTIAYNPVADRIYLLDQQYVPISIDPVTGEVNRPYKSKPFNNIPKRQLLSYGKLWFSNNGRCFLLAGQEGIIYELDTENLNAYFIAQIGFNSSKDAIPHDNLSIPYFLGKELLNLKIQKYKHNDQFLELEWRERNDKNPVSYYYTQRLNLQSNQWEEIGYIPGYPSNNQANRYTYLDRNPTFGDYCYRLLIIYFGGYVRYSQSVCYNENSQNTQKLSFSHSIIDYNEDEVLVHLLEYKNKKTQIIVRNLISNKIILDSELTPKSVDYSFTLKLGSSNGWHEISIIEGKNIEKIRIFKM